MVTRVQTRSVTHLVHSSSLFITLLFLLTTEAELTPAEPVGVVRRHVAEVSEDVLKRLIIS